MSVYFHPLKLQLHIFARYPVCSLEVPDCTSLVGEDLEVEDSRFDCVDIHLGRWVDTASAAPLDSSHSQPLRPLLPRADSTMMGQLTCTVSAQQNSTLSYQNVEW